MFIINADDYGISQEVNEAIEYCFENGLINQTTLMVNMSYTDSAVQRVLSGEFRHQVGLHLNLIEGKPLTEPIRKTDLCNKEGFFNGEIMSSKRKRIFLGTIEKNAVCEEIEAQIKKYLDYGFTLKHIDSHQHAHTNPSVLGLLLPIAKRYGFESVRLTRNIPMANIKGVKKCLKSRVNAKILRFNEGSQRYQGIVNFGSRNDVDKQFHNGFVENTEMMVHPVMVENQLKEALDTITLEQWFSHNGHVRRFL